MKWLSEKGLLLFCILACVSFGIWGMRAEAFDVAKYAVMAVAVIAAGEVVVQSVWTTKSKSGNVVIGWNNVVRSESSAEGPIATDREIYVKTDISFEEHII